MKSEQVLHFIQRHILLILAAVVMTVVIGLFMKNHTDPVPPERGFFKLNDHTIEVTAEGITGTGDSAIVINWYSAQNRYSDDFKSSILLMKLDWYGEELSTVKFTADRGYFIYYIFDNDLNDEEIFTSEGSNILQLDNDMLNSELHLYWTLGWVDENIVFPENIKLSTGLIFNDGITVEQSFELETMKINTDINKWRDINEFLANVDLDDCELIPESVKPFKYYYEFVVRDTPGMRQIIEYERTESMDDFLRKFNENGIYRFDSSHQFGIDLLRGYIAVIKLDDEGIMTAMVYRTPMM